MLLKKLLVDKTNKQYKRGVSPVIGIVLLIALVVASVATVWVITSGFLESGAQGEVVIQNAGVADKTGNDLGDYLRIVARNIGSEAVTAERITVLVNNQVASSWVLSDSYEITTTSELEIVAITAQSSDMITSQDEVEIYLLDDGGIISNNYDVTVPGILASQPILYESGDEVSTADLAAQGWQTHQIGTHSGGSGAGFEVVPQNPNEITVSTNDDLLFVLENNDYSITNFILSSEITNGDDDALGFVFRYQDINNYYWVGTTSNHHSSSNTAGDATNGNIPYFEDNRNRIVFGKVEGGVTSILGFSDIDPTLAGQINTETWTKTFQLVVSDDTFSMEVDGQEMVTVTDTTFSDAGYIGLMGLAALDSRFGQIIIQR